MPAATSSAIVVKAITIAVPRSGCVATSRIAAPTTTSSGLSQVAQVVHALRALGQQRRGVQHERELHQLRGLELQRPGADPAPRAVDADADVRDVHGEHEHERRSTSSGPVIACTFATPSRASTRISTSPTPP